MHRADNGRGIALTIPGVDRATGLYERGERAVHLLELHEAIDAFAVGSGVHQVERLAPAEYRAAQVQVEILAVAALNRIDVGLDRATVQPTTEAEPYLCERGVRGAGH